METHYYGGIDFSGAREPLSNLWSAVGHEREGKLHVVTLSPHPFRQDLAHHVAGGWRKSAGAAGDAPILWGADFPFGIPRAALAALGGEGTEPGWEALLAWVADRPADEVRAAFPDHHKTPRTTDTGTAMAPFDLRLYRQTAEGLRWLHELRETGEVAVLPQAPRPGAATTLVEVYPSVTVTDLGIRCRRAPSRPGEVRARPAALRPYLTFAHPCLEATAVALEDAWDAVIACLTAFLVRDDPEQPHRVHPQRRATLEKEGWIYRVPQALA